MRSSVGPTSCPRWRACTRVVEEERPRLAVLLGQAGVGKTRLIDEFVARIALPSAPAVYRGRCLSYGEGITYWALREVLWAATGIALGDPAVTAASKLRERVTAVVDPADADRVIAALAIASGIALPDNPLRRVSPGSVADEVALAWPAFLTGLAADGPVLVVIEDAHWAEEPLLQMVQLIVARSAGPVLLVVSARARVQRGAWRVDDRPRDLADRLGAADRETVACARRGAAPQRSFRAHRARRRDCRGKPAVRRGACKAGVRHERRTIGYSEHRACSARRARGRLPKREKQALQDAAVVGRGMADDAGVDRSQV